LFTNFAETSEFAKAGRLRALGVSGAKRMQTMPEVPTIAEAGLPGYEFTTWHGMWAPKNTPRAIVALLNDRIRQTLTAPDQQKRFQARGLDVIASSPEDFAAHVLSEHKKWGRVIKERGMKAE
jgi:tripartite-type tricarboxylate transporter receptor subunit TctC